MLAAMLPASGLPFHTVYVATAIASGSSSDVDERQRLLVVFEMGGVTEIEPQVVDSGPAIRRSHSM